MPVKTRSDTKSAAQHGHFKPVNKLEDLQIQESHTTFSDYVAGLRQFGPDCGYEMKAVTISDLPIELSTASITIGTPFVDEESSRCCFLVNYDAEKFYNKATEPARYQAQCLSELINYQMIAKLVNGHMKSCYVALGMGKTGLMVTVTLSEVLFEKFKETFGEVQQPSLVTTAIECAF